MRIHVLFFVVIICCLFACTDRMEKTEASSLNLLIGDEAQNSIPRTAEPPPPPDDIDRAKEAEVIQNTIEKGSKIIKDGKIVVKVEDLVKAKTKIDSSLKALKAYYENESYQNGTYRSTYYLTIRVPAENFEKLLIAVESEGGEITQKNIKARDVTEEYVDVAIRLNNHKNYLKRYQDLLKKANTIKDILEIQEKTRRIEEEMDAKTGRLRFIDDKVRFSTLSIELFQEHEHTIASKPRNFIKQVGIALQGGFNAFLDFLLFLINLWPFILLFFLIWTFRKRLFRFNFRKKQ